MTRQFAALNHLVLSLIVFGGVVYLMTSLWFPGPHFLISGGWEGLQIAASVDLVLGPLMTLIVFNVKKPKKELVTDVAIIILLQLSALSWGLNTIYHQRPFAMVFFGDSFYSVPAYAFENQNISLKDLKQFGQQHPVLIYVERPKKPSPEFEKMKHKIEVDNVLPVHQVDLYKPFASKISELKSNPLFLVDINKIILSDLNLKNELMSVLDKTSKTLTDYSYFWLYSKDNNIILMIDQDVEIVAYFQPKIE